MWINGGVCLVARMGPMVLSLGDAQPISGRPRAYGGRPSTLAIDARARDSAAAAAHADI